MSWADPTWWLLLAPIAALGLAMAWGAHQGWKRLGLALGPTLRASVLPEGVRRRRRWREAAVLVGLALGMVALVEPRWGKELQAIESRGTNLVLVLDVSRSMDALDVDPSRLVRAQREISDLLRVMQGDRVALVLFAGGAFPRLPLTADLQAVRTVVEEARTSNFEAQGSSLAAGLRVGLELLRRSEEPAGQAMVVFSDGESHDGGAMAVADEAAADGVLIFTVGIGEKSSPIPLPAGDVVRDAGEVVLSEPNFEELTEIARRTRAAFVRSTASPDDMAQLYEAGIRRSLVAVKRDAQQRESWKSGYWAPALAGWVLIWLGLVGGDGRRLATVVVLAALVLAPTSSARAAEGLAELAERAYRAGDFAEAQRRYTELALQRPGDPEVLERLGAARYRAGDAEGALRAWDQALQVDPGRADAAYNAGNAAYRVGRLEDALRHYDRALSVDPGHPAAQANRQRVAQEIEARRKISPPPPPPPPQGGEGEERGGGEEPPPEGEGPPPPPDGQGEGDGSEREGEAPPGEQGDSTPEGADAEGQGEEGEGAPGAPGAPAPGEGEEGEPGSGQGTAGEDQGPISAAEAARLLDGVEEGSQGLNIGGARGSRPW